MNKQRHRILNRKWLFLLSVFMILRAVIMLCGIALFTMGAWNEDFPLIYAAGACLALLILLQLFHVMECHKIICPDCRSQILKSRPNWIAVKKSDDPKLRSTCFPFWVPCTVDEPIEKSKPRPSGFQTIVAPPPKRGKATAGFDEKARFRKACLELRNPWRSNCESIVIWPKRSSMSRRGKC